MHLSSQRRAVNVGGADGGDATGSVLFCFRFSTTGNLIVVHAKKSSRSITSVLSWTIVDFQRRTKMVTDSTLSIRALTGRTIAPLACGRIAAYFSIAMGLCSMDLESCKSCV